ncbi:hypothetical protein FRC03_002995 [Tulasnella sp. 419]|nr:hypothetical protein FRC03_002995 [Tulasnella sp. 419]
MEARRKNRNASARFTQETPESFDQYAPHYSGSWKLDDNTSFWHTYITEAEKFDKELVDGWNQALDNLLVFSGLFSAVNTAFIIETYKLLQPDPAEDTADMFRLFLKHRHDNHQFLDEELRFGFTASPRHAVRTNSIFFASLSCSLLVAIGAVQGKDWLTQYDHNGLAAKPQSHQARVRQEKFDGLERWRFPLFVTLLPLLLQISLALFLAGVIAFLWEINSEVASVVMAIAMLGFVGYLASWVIAVYYPTSPFQTPLSVPLRKPLIALIALIRWIARGTKASIARMLPLQLLGLLSSLYDKNPVIRWSEDLQKVASIVAERLRGFKKESENAIGQLIVERNLKDQTSAECVGWLFEQAEQPTVVLRTLSVSSLLPPDYVLAAFKRRSGLLDRLALLYDSCLQEPIGEETSVSDPEEAIITGIALFHVLKAQAMSGFDGSQVELSSYRMRSINRTKNQVLEQDKICTSPVSMVTRFEQVPRSSEGDADAVAGLPKDAMLDQVLAEVICCVETVLPISDGVESANSFQKCFDYSHYTPDSFNHSVTVQLSTTHCATVSRSTLLLDIIIASGIRHIHNPRWIDDWFTRYKIPDFLRCLNGVLENKPPHETISHIAIAVAVVQLARSSPQADKGTLRRRLKDIQEAWATVFNSIVVAFTMIDINASLDDQVKDIYFTLLSFLNEYLPKEMEESKGSGWRTWWPHAMNLYPSVIDFLSLVGELAETQRRQVLRVFARLLPDDWQYEDIRRAFVTGYTKEKCPQLHALSPDPPSLYTNREYCPKIIEWIIQSIQVSDGKSALHHEVEGSAIEILGWIVAYTCDKTHLPAQILKQEEYIKIPQILISVLIKYAPRVQFEPRNSSNAIICRHAARHLIALAEIEAIRGTLVEDVKRESLFLVLEHRSLISKWLNSSKEDIKHPGSFFVTETQAADAEKAQDIGDDMLQEIMRFWRDLQKQSSSGVNQFYSERAINIILTFVEENRRPSILSEPITLYNMAAWLDEAKANTTSTSTLAQRLHEAEESLRRVHPYLHRQARAERRDEENR